ncbi:nuclear transport factor 2 family protein [Sorangium sp. So ce861]|uniref:nuclear transport factor 2 family protein n=1 Tax=Sorangium sp. So ce861 TaxID=3133323 RepID=UPI003F61978F
MEAANSALFRARSANGSKIGGAEPVDIARTTQVDPRLLEQYVRAFEEANLDALVALFHEDMRTTMPPAPTWVSGRAANERFYRLMFGSIERTVSGASSRSARACAPRERRRGEVPAARLDLPRRAAPGHTAV